MTEIEQALEHHRAGRLAQAEVIYRQILAQEPCHPDALHLLGVAAHQGRRHDIAVELIRKAIDIDPSVSIYHNNLGEALRPLQRWDEAVTAYERALALNPDYAEAYNNLGLALHAQGHVNEAITAYQKALALQPDFETHYHLGTAFKDQARLPEAIVEYRQALGFKPDFPDAYNDLGAALTRQGQLTAAVAAYKQVLALKPDSAEAQYNLGNVLTQQRKPAEAIAAYRRAIHLDSDYVDAYLNLGNALQKAGQLAHAIATYRRALVLEPNNPELYNNLGLTLKDQGKLSEAIAAYRQALALEPEHARAHSNLLFSSHYQSQIDPAELFSEHQRWAQTHAMPLADDIQPHGNDPGHRRLRIGYVSPDFRVHSVAYFFEPLLNAHDRTAFEIICYANVRQPDAVTERLQGLADKWHNIVHMADDRVADLVREDGVDILVDLAGHTAHNRMLVFARKPAPVQVTYLGYPNTTGLATMDYRLTDAWADPPGQTEKFHVEELLRLPGGFLCYQPPQESPKVTELPARAAGYVTFGSFNNSTKITSVVVDVWSKILRPLPDARLIMKSYQLGDAWTRQYFVELFEQGGVSPERLELLGPTESIADHLRTYNRVDIGLDPFPYNGTTTTCDVLWMGVPVIVLAGNTHASRVGTSLLSNAGCPQFIAQTVESYVELAVRLAKDRERLHKLRSELRAKMEHSPLTDARRFARNVETAYRTMWERWCEKT
jgi:predicted O-linked N-acetylglucosamine transferase (SPINDLY family)